MAISEPTVGTGIWPIVKHRLARTARFGAELIAAFVGEAILSFSAIWRWPSLPGLSALPY
jgi:hypothetical protein